MLLIVDNRDSFVFNLDQAFRGLGAATNVVRGDRRSAGEVLAADYEAIILSPGPGRPRDAGCLLDLVRRLPPQLPVLGVCLGYQALAECDGGRIVPAGEVVHGRPSAIVHDGSSLFAGIDNPFEACRYHSLIVEREPPGWIAAAWTEDRQTIMAMRHEELPRWGVQFHPESFRTPQGPRLIANFWHLVTERSAA